MLNFIEKMLKLNKVDDASGGGAPPKSEDPPKTPPNDPPPKADGDDEYDEFGYKKETKEDPAPGDKKQEGDSKKKTPPEKPEKVENPATGYGDEEPKVDEPAPPEPPKDPPPPPTDLEKKLEGLNKAFADKVKQQIADLGLEGEKLDKFIAHKKQEQKEANDWTAQQQSEMKRQEQIRKQTWHKELKEDPAFGGDKFAVNLSRSEKVLDEYGAELKKELTDAKQVLRPSVMRMLARLADQLYPDRQMVHGDPPAPGDKDGDKDKPNNPLDFYV